jgi:hypothetical protein
LKQIIDGVEPSDQTAQIPAHGPAVLADPFGEALGIGCFWRHRFHDY